MVAKPRLADAELHDSDCFNCDGRSPCGNYARPAEPPVLRGDCRPSVRFKERLRALFPRTEDDWKVVALTRSLRVAAEDREASACLSLLFWAHAIERHLGLTSEIVAPLPPRAAGSDADDAARAIIAQIIDGGPIPVTLQEAEDAIERARVATPCATRKMPNAERPSFTGLTRPYSWKEAARTLNYGSAGKLREAVRRASKDDVLSLLREFRVPCGQKSSGQKSKCREDVVLYILEAFTSAPQLVTERAKAVRAERARELEPTKPWAAEGVLRLGALRE